MLPLILASSSPYRRQLMDKLQLSYHWQSPLINEAPITGELPASLAARLSREKAMALADQYPAHLIIGCDQVASLGNEILGKPGNHQAAARQLSLSSGQVVTFITGLSLLNSATGHCQTITDQFRVTFRELTSSQIDNYLDREKPWDCAGSFKSEGLGIALFSKLEGNDPNSLIGLPLIRLIDLLAHEGVHPLGQG